MRKTAEFQQSDALYYPLRGLEAIKALLILFLAVLLGGASVCAAPRPQKPEAERIRDAQQGLDLLLNGEIDAALKIFGEIKADNPDSPLGYLLEADAFCWKIYMTTGNLVDPDVFEVEPNSTSPYDAQFVKLVNEAISKSEANIRSRQSVAKNHLYEGLAYALRARLLAMRSSNLATVRSPRKMRSLLIKALQEDPNLRDAYLGLGLYGYFVDTLPTIVRFLRLFIGLPGGSRKRGFEEIEYAAKNGELTRGEALFYLAKDYPRPNEEQFATSLELFEQLQSRYPRNALWTLLVGSMEIRLGHAEKGEAVYRELLNRTHTDQTEAGKAVYAAAQKALKNLRH